MMFYFYNTCLNLFDTSSLFSGGMMISLTGFKNFLLYELATASMILFPINSSIASTALWTTLLQAVFKTFIPVSNTYFPYMLDNFFVNDKSPYLLTYFLFLVL